jgi:metal-responsive CopG/Arc/MetJ family transcriptional regulator
MDEEHKPPAILAFRVPPALVERIDRFAEDRCVNRSDAARQLLIVGLERSTKGERAA